MRYITVALAKGRLADRAMEYFSRIGCPCEEMKSESESPFVRSCPSKSAAFSPIDESAIISLAYSVGVGQPCGGRCLR